MSRFFVSKEAVRGNSITISGSEAHHILDVMRLRTLDKVVAFDGTGREYIGYIKEAKRGSLLIEIIETKRPVNKEMSKITLVQAIPKRDKMDYIVEKTTELGVYSIIPILTKRTIPRWNEKKKSLSVERWRRLAREASKQCGRTEIPTVDGIRSLDDLLKNSSDYDLALMAALSEEAIRLKDALAGFHGGKIAIAIGPEGDFTPDETRKAEDANFKLVNLGPRVLKSDTAGVAVISILNYEFSS